MIMTRTEPGESGQVPPAHTNPRDIEEVLRDLFQSLESQDVRYAALRVTDDVLRAGQEIDLLVAPFFLRSVMDEIFTLCARFSWIQVAYWRELPLHAATVIFTWQGIEGSREHYFFDIRCGVYKHGHLLVDGRELDAETTVWDSRLGLRRMRDDLECALLMVRNALDDRGTKERHEWILGNRWAEDVPETVRELGFRYEAIERGEVEPTGRTNSLPRRLAQARYGLRALYGRARCRGGGMNIVLYGPDGVGKSTQAEMVAAFFRRIGVRSERVEVYHAFRKVETMRNPSPSGSASLKRAAYKGARRRATRVLILVAGFLKRLMIYHVSLRRRARRGTLQVHDRYFLDVFLKFFKTHEVRLPAVEQGLSRLSPRGDTIAVLRADPNVVSERTGELSPIEVADTYDLLDACLEWSGASRAVHDLDANRAPDEVFDSVVDTIVTVQTRRCLRRAGIPSSGLTGT